MCGTSSTALSFTKESRLLTPKKPDIVKSLLQDLGYSDGALFIDAVVEVT